MQGLHEKLWKISTHVYVKLQDKVGWNTVPNRQEVIKKVDYQLSY